MCWRWDKVGHQLYVWDHALSYQPWWGGKGGNVLRSKVAYAAEFAPKGSLTQPPPMVILGAIQSLRQVPPDLAIKYMNGICT